ncbi:MAG: PocR ligand-binding domain-containing protein [Planctomycetaceae bacterium]|nr:PocR ligand-binding domain-containing protein [Planctomycetaceae bacterium]
MTKPVQKGEATEALFKTQAGNSSAGRNEAGSDPQSIHASGALPQDGSTATPGTPDNTEATDQVELADIIDVKALQSLMNDFYELTRVPMAIIDISGKVLVGVGWQQICTEFHRVNPVTCRYCIESDLELTSGIDESEFKLYKCKNNMWDAAAPLIVGGRKMGNIFAGQFFFEDETPDYELFRAQAVQYGFDQAEYMAALQKVSRLSRSTFKHGTSFLHGMAKMISQGSYVNLRLARLVEQQQQTEKALRQSEQQFHSMFERHHAIKLVIDPRSGAIRDANEAAARFYGYSRPQLCRMRIEDLNQLPANEIEAERRQAAAEQRNYFVFPHRLADGSVRTVEVYSSPVHIGGKQLLYSIIHDITERKKAEEQIQKAAARFEILSDTASKLLESKQPQQIIDSLCRRVMQLLDCQVFVNYLVDEAAGRLHLNASGGLPEKMARAIEWLDFGSAICGRVAQSGQRIVAEEIQQSCDERADLVRSIGIRAYACHPILAQGKVLGTVSFGTRTRGRFSEDDLEMMKTVTDQVAAAIERKLGEEALRQSQLDFSRAQAVGSIGSWRLDVRKNELVWSDETHRIFGIGKGTPMTYETFLSAVHPDDRDMIRACWQKALEGSEYDVEHRIIADGAVTWVREKAYLEFDARGGLVAGFGIAQDITYRKKIEDDLRRLNESLEQRVARRTAQLNDAMETARAERQQFYNVLETLPVYVCLLTPDYQMPFANHKFREWFGYREGQKCYEFLWNRTEPCEDCQTYSVMKTGAPHQWDWTGPNGCHYSVFDFPFRDTDGSTLILEMGIDVTQRRRAEQGLRELNETLEQRIELRTAELRQSDEKLRTLNESLEERVLERTREVSEQADQLRALANQLTRAEQRERKRLAKILHDHIQQLIVAAKLHISSLRNDPDPRRRATLQAADALLKDTLEASRSLTVDLSPPALQEGGLISGLQWLSERMRIVHQFEVRLHADRSAEPINEEIRVLVFECARELLFNALKHSGVLEASVTLARTGDNRIELTVSDEGKGFDPAVLNNRRSSEITFGLFSIRQRLAHLGGLLEVDTAPGRGARFILSVAAETVSETHPAAAAPCQAETAVRKARPSRTCRVLVCDDHKIVREGLAKLLQLEPWIEVAGQAADGQQVIQMAVELAPDVIIMDVNIGQISGIEATRRIRAANSRIKIIGLSMHEDHNIALAMRNAGASAYLTKSGPSEELVAAVRACAG